MSTEKVVEFVPLLDFESDYEILNDYPFTIRRKKDHYEISEYHTKGYVQVSLNLVSHMKHILIAKQFIQNDDSEHKTQVDHINHDRSDYHLSNLRWVTPSENQRNRTSTCNVNYTFVDELSDDSIKLTDYGNHKFDEYYYDESTDKFYFWNGIQYRELHVNVDKYGLNYVNAVNINKNRVKIYYSKFKRLYNIE